MTKRTSELTPGARMKAWRVERDLTQAEAAEKAGITQNAWSEYERDVPQNASVSVASRIAAATGIEIEAWAAA